MKEFLVGLIFLFGVLVLSVLGILLLPLLLLMTFALRVVFGIFLFLFAIWLLGKFILWVWDQMSPKPKNEVTNTNQ